MIKKNSSHQSLLGFLLYVLEDLWFYTRLLLILVSPFFVSFGLMYAGGIRGDRLFSGFALGFIGLGLMGYLRNQWESYNRR